MFNLLVLFTLKDNPSKGISVLISSFLILVHLILIKNETMFGERENNFLEKLFSMKNIFLRKINFHITFFIVLFKINYFYMKKKKCKLNNFNNENIHQIIILKTDIDQVRVKNTDTNY